MFAQADDKDTDKKEPPKKLPLLTPRRKVRCSNFDKNTQDYTTNFDPLTTICSSFAFQEASALQQLRNHNTNVQRIMSLDNMRRYSRHNIQLSTNTTIKAEEKKKLMDQQKPIVDKAISNYKITANKYLTEINTLASKLDPTSTMQDCQQITQTATISQMSDANGLIILPTTICDEFNSAYAAFEKSLDAVYVKIGQPIPT